MGLRGNELRRQRVRDEFRQRRAGQQQIDDVVAAEGAALAEEMLAAVVMPGGAKAERAAVGIDAPACEGTCGRLEIGFGVAPLAEREEQIDALLRGQRFVDLFGVVDRKSTRLNSNP